MTPLLATTLPPFLKPNPGLMLWTLITFFIAMYVMYKFAFRPIQKALDDRRQAIVDSVETAERTRDEAAKLLDEYKTQLAEARIEAEQIVNRARTAGDELTARVKAEAEEQRRGERRRSRPRPSRSAGSRLGPRHSSPRRSRPCRPLPASRRRRSG